MQDGVTEQDTKLPVMPMNRKTFIAVNKWDVVEKETGTLEKTRETISKQLEFMSMRHVFIC